MTLRIKLTPPEPYFLGGERIFEVGDNNRHYFIRSLKTPAQTTLFGILRFLALTNVSAQPRILTKEEGEKYGSGGSSYNLFSPNPAGFGKISGISPLYLMDCEGNYYIRTPFDHNVGEHGEDEQEYAPFEKYVADALETKKFPCEYTAKKVITDSWLCLTADAGKEGKYKTFKKLFGCDTRTGIDKNRNLHAFVKKEYAVLAKGFSFVFFADVADDFVAGDRFVQPGFSAEVERSAEPAIPPDLLRSNILCAQSDIYLHSEETNRLYRLCDFVCVKTRGFRGRTTNPAGKTVSERFERYPKIATLIQAGSVFMPKKDQKANAIQILTGNAHVRIAGFNHIISGGTTL
jgi:hypothetical protein